MVFREIFKGPCMSDLPLNRARAHIFRRWRFSLNEIKKSGYATIYIIAFPKGSRHQFFDLPSLQVPVVELLSLN